MRSSGRPPAAAPSAAVAFWGSSEVTASGDCARQSPAVFQPSPVMAPVGSGQASSCEGRGPHL
eukprot:scaffold89838_cov33-Phaeocystis_antarctica.AAC.1